MEPVITLIVTAAALGAAAGLKPTAEQAVKDAYIAFKQVIIDHYSDYRDLIDALDFLGKKPEDSNRQSAFKDELTNAGAIEDSALIQAAKTIHIAVEAQDPDTPIAIGMDIEELKATILEVENVQAGEVGTAVRIEKAEIKNTASFKNIGGKQSTSDPN